jgi:hypothetical protein
MKHLLCTIAPAICFLQINLLSAQTVMLDNFDKEPPNVGKKYSSFVGTQRGYDVYYKKAAANLSLDKTNPRDSSDKALRMAFELPPLFDWGNWLSVRREFQPPMNLANYKGLLLNLRVDAPAPDAFLRITLADLTDDMQGGDELWWFDCDKNLLKSKTPQWIQLRIPFVEFSPAFGEGTRFNDGKKNLKKIIAYEISLISDAGKHAQGVILLDSLRAYK